MKIKNVLLQVLTLSLLPLSATAQKQVSIDWYGFVAAQSFTDTHASQAKAEGFLYQFPLDKDADLQGNDLNSYTYGSEFGTMARLGFTLKGPDILGASTRAKAEIEFSGHKSGEILYRHAFMAFDWDDGGTLILGQTWHPMNDLFPSTVGIAIGAPFNPLNRSPQLRGEGFLDKNQKIKLTIACIFQSMNTSTGPAGNSYNYIRNSLRPMIYGGLDFKLGDLKLGAGVEYQDIVPLMDATDNNKKYHLTGFTGMVQAHYAKDKLSIKAKGLLGQNMSHLGICSGYGQVADPDNTGKIEYAPLTALSTWAQVQYGGALKFGLFGGYMKNYGADKDLDPKEIYAIGGGNIDSMWRLTPNVTYTAGNVVFGCEFEFTSVAYGKVESKGTVTDTHDVNNLRTLLSVMYNF